LILLTWAKKYGVSHDALRDLMAIIGAEGMPASQPHAGMLEGAVSSRVRLAAAKKHILLYRNNVGACEDATGRWIRYGLCNDSKALNEKFKSNDLIGITPHEVVEADVGKLLGIFTSIETKREGWSYTGTARETAQLNWITLVLSHGGIAKFVTNEEDL